MAQKVEFISIMFQKIYNKNNNILSNLVLLSIFTVISCGGGDTTRTTRVIDPVPAASPETNELLKTIAGKWVSRCVIFGGSDDTYAIETNEFSSPNSWKHNRHLYDDNQCTKSLVEMNFEGSFSVNGRPAASSSTWQINFYVQKSAMTTHNDQITESYNNDKEVCKNGNWNTNKSQDMSQCTLVQDEHETSFNGMHIYDIVSSDGAQLFLGQRPVAFPWAVTEEASRPSELSKNANTKK